MNPDDYDNDGNNIVPCPICLDRFCPSKEDGKCPEEDDFIKAIKANTMNEYIQEKEQAIKLANHILDTPYKDPDDNESMLARQFLRALEREENAYNRGVEEGQKEYKQFVLNVLDGTDIADGFCNTEAIRFALESRTIENIKNLMKK